MTNVVAEYYIYEVWYDDEHDELYLYYQRMLDEWVFECQGFISPQYTHIPPYVTGLIYIGAFE